MSEKNYCFELKGIRVTDSSGNTLLDTGSVVWPTLTYGEVVGLQKALVSVLNKTITWGEEVAKERGQLVPS